LCPHDHSNAQTNRDSAGQTVEELFDIKVGPESSCLLPWQLLFPAPCTSPGVVQKYLPALAYEKNEPMKQ